MREKVRKTIEEFHMFPQGARIVVGVSGGADSVALLHLLSGWQAAYDWRLTAVHIHHGLRGEEADKDQAFVEALCRTLGIPCIIRRFDVAKEARTRGLGEEETGRLLRYAVFQEMAGEEGYIAVAHHRGDQAETLLMRLCRGTGLTGLVGMREVRGNLCRPLLECSRQEIEAYCRQEGLFWREDATNQQDTYTRNKLRLRVLPLLEEVNPLAVEHMAQTAALLAAEEDYLSEQAEQIYAGLRLPSVPEEVHLPKDALSCLHPAMQSRLLRRALAEFVSADVSRSQVKALQELLEKPTGKRRDLLQGVAAENRYGTLVLFRKKDKKEGFCVELPPEGEVLLSEGGISVKMQIFDKKNTEFSEDGCTNVFDYDKINQILFCRSRQQGDSIRLKGGRKKIKDLFIDEKIPRAERENYPLIAMREEILWVPGLRSAADYLPDEQTKRVLRIEIRRVQEYEGKN